MQQNTITPRYPSDEFQVPLSTAAGLFEKGGNPTLVQSPGIPPPVDREASFPSIQLALPSLQIPPRHHLEPEMASPQATKETLQAATGITTAAAGDSARYRQLVRDQLFSPWNGRFGFLDQYGYVVDYYLP